MLKFNWKYISRPTRKIIYWEAKWDRKFFNDPLIPQEDREIYGKKIGEYFNSPLSLTAEYKEMANYHETLFDTPVEERGQMMTNYFSLKYLNEIKLDKKTKTLCIQSGKEKYFLDAFISADGIKKIKSDNIKNLEKDFLEKYLIPESVDTIFPTILKIHDPDRIKEVFDYAPCNLIVREICATISDLEKLSLECGDTHPFVYRTNLLGCLSLLWE